MPCLQRTFASKGALAYRNDRHSAPAGNGGIPHLPCPCSIVWETAPANGSRGSSPRWMLHVGCRFKNKPGCVSWAGQKRSRFRGALRTPGWACGRGRTHPGRFLAEQLEDRLWDLVGLGEDRGTGLLQDLRTGHVGHFHRVVGVLDARLRSRQVGGGGGEIGD